MLAMPSSTAAFTGHGDLGFREAPQPLEDATDLEQPQQGCPLSPASMQPKSARRSHRRRRRIAQQKASAISDANTQPSSSVTPQSTAEADMLTGADDASNGGNAADSLQKLRRRNVVTLSDLGLDLTMPTHKVSPSTSQVAAPLAVCPDSLASPSHSCGGCWVQATSEPASYSQVGWQLSSGNNPLGAPAAWAAAIDIQQQRIMGTYPTAGPCPLSVAAAGEASQRSPALTPMVSPTAARAHGSHQTTPLLASWLHANGMQSSGADLAEQLRAIAPESYED